MLNATQYQGSLEQKCIDCTCTIYMYSMQVFSQFLRTNRRFSIQFNVVLESCTKQHRAYFIKILLPTKKSIPVLT